MHRPIITDSYLKAMAARRADEQRAAGRAAERERLLQQTRRARQARQEEHEKRCAAEIAAEEEKQKKARAEWAAERERVAECVRQAQKAQIKEPRDRHHDSSTRELSASMSDLGELELVVGSEHAFDDAPIDERVADSSWSTTRICVHPCCTA